MVVVFDVYIGNNMTGNLKYGDRKSTIFMGIQIEQSEHHLYIGYFAMFEYQRLRNNHTIHNDSNYRSDTIVIVILNTDKH